MSGAKRAIHSTACLCDIHGGGGKATTIAGGEIDSHIGLNAFWRFLPELGRARRGQFFAWNQRSPLLDFVAGVMRQWRFPYSALTRISVNLKYLAMYLTTL
jgi:hypothetical protein